MYLYHSGVKGMRWGIRNGPPYPLNGPSANSLNNSMKSFRYKEFTKLMSPEQVRRTKSGSCHDQVMYELEELRKMGYNPKAKFFMDVDPKTGQGYQTHSFVYYKDHDKTIWFENAWEDQRGLHVYNNYREMIADISKKHRTPASIKTYWGNFDDSKMRPGMDLQQIVDACLK